ncbi:MAG: hypothetical protein QHH04_06840 [Methanolinea sp.]|jgi:hypothetical protein|nr:hypothetical protein [Methanolinea sp.]
MLDVPVILLGAILLFCIPAILIGAFVTAFYFALRKLPRIAGDIAPFVVAFGLTAITPAYHKMVTLFPFSLLIELGILATGVLTPYMFLDRFFPTKSRTKIVFPGSVIAITGRLVYGFSGVFGDGTGSPIFHLVTSFATSDANFLILNSIALYVEMVIGATVVFGIINAAMVIMRLLRRRIAGH